VFKPAVVSIHSKRVIMKRRLDVRSRTLGLLVGAVFLIGALVVWFFLSSPPALRLTFLYQTNSPQSRIVGVFKLVNELDESVSSGGGHFQDANRNGLSPQEGDWGAGWLGGTKQFAPRTTSILQIPLPPKMKAGPYKLVLHCSPASKSTQQYQRGARARIVSFLSPWLHPSFATQGRWYGEVYPVSQAFDIRP
jgi:hypothetical protein